MEARALVVCWFLQQSSKVKESSLNEIWNADTAFLLKLGSGTISQRPTNNEATEKEKKESEGLKDKKQTKQNKKKTW